MKEAIVLLGCNSLIGWQKPTTLEHIFPALAVRYKEKEYIIGLINCLIQRYEPHIDCVVENNKWLLMIGINKREQLSYPYN